MTAARLRLIVPSERHVERLSLGAHARGEIVETRATLRDRLLAELAPEIVLATPVEARVALAEALPPIAAGDALLAPLLRAGGLPWLRTLDAIDGSLGVLREAGIAQAGLAGRVPAAIAARVELLRGVVGAVDAALARAGRVDPRSAGMALARALGAADPERVRDLVGADRVVAKWIIAWDGSDTTWWGALDTALRRAGGGGAVVELPSVDRPLDTDRERAPLEIVADELARALDEAPALAALDTPLGDLSLAGSLDEGRASVLEIRHTVDARAQARAAVEAVRAAIVVGTPIDAIAIALPSPSDETLAPLLALLDDARIAADAPRLTSPARGGLAACAMGALSLASRGLGRRDVAALLRSGYVELRGGATAGATAAELARALEETPTVRAADPVLALEATARAWRRDLPEHARDALASLARTLGSALAQVDAPRTRSAHAAAARALWGRLGLAPHVESALMRTLADDAPTSGIARAVLHAAASDARGWNALGEALATIESATEALGLADRIVSSESFRDELAFAMRFAILGKDIDSTARQPAAARAAAVRLVEMAEIAGEELALLVVIDANDGALPPVVDADPFVSEAVAAWLRDRGRAAPPMSSLRRARHLATLAAATSRARRIVFTCRERDDAGALLAPAPLVAWLARSGVRATRVSTSSLAGAPLTEREATLRGLVGGVETALARSIAPDPARRACIERERESLFESSSPARTELRGSLRADREREAILADETGGGDRAMSVTALEHIATCPFQGFASQVLRARDDAPIDETPGARELGTSMHGALAAAFLATAGLWSARPRDPEAILLRALAAAGAYLEGEPAASSLRRIEIERTRAGVEAVVRWSLADEEWDFVHAEMAFGGTEGWPPIVLADADGTRVVLRGSIDRVDVAHGRAAVRAIDYKSGTAAAADAGKRLGDTTFQVALYARAAAAFHRATQIDGLYLPTRGRALVLFKRSSKHVEAWSAAHDDASGRPAIDARALDVVRDLRRGAVMPSPYAEIACSRCSYDGGCRKPRFAIRVDDELEGEGEGDG